MKEFFREDFAAFLNELFAKPEVIKQIALSTQKVNGNLNRISHSVGQVIHFYMATRSKNTDVSLVKQILEQADQNVFGAGKQVARELGIQLMQQNIMPSAQNVLALLKQNLVDRCLLMHATCEGHLQGILKDGFDYQIKPHQEEKDFMSSLFDYEYNFRSNRLYVTSHYGVLYNYGIYSPEWLTSLVGDRELIKNRQPHKAFQVMCQKIDDRKWNEQTTQKAKQYAQKLAHVYFEKSQDVAVVLFDRMLTDEDGKRVFNRYNEEEDSFDESAFSVETLQTSLGKVIDANKSIFVSPEAFEFVAEATSRLVNRTSVFEFSTLSKILPKDFSVAMLPSYQTFAKHVPMEQIQE